MEHPSATIRYRDEDRELFDVERLSGHAQISRAFIRLCISLGCPTHSAQLSQAMLLDWLFEHYSKVRRGAGLAPLASIEGVSNSVLQKLKMGNAMLTLVDFAESRSSGAFEKQQLRRVHSMIARALDRA